MRVITILIAILVAPGLSAQEGKPWPIDRLCGKIGYVQKIPSRKNPSTFSEKRTTLKDVPLALYEKNEAKACCGGVTAIETTRTGRGGQFEFKTRKAGSFWLIASWNGKDYQAPILYYPQKNSTVLCSQQGITLDKDGKADWWLTVTVD